MENSELILNLEKELLKPEVRKSPEKLRKLLSEDFIEYRSSGVIYHYEKDDIFYEDNVTFELQDFNLQELSEDCVLTTFKIDKIYHEDNFIKSSIRSSIWKLYDGKWKMIFHQGTLIT